MSTQMVTVLARIKPKTGMEEQLYETLRALVGPTRRETGCLTYDLHRSTTEPTEFLFHEQWATADDLKAHSTSEHLQKYRQVASTLVETAEVTRWTRVEDVVPARARPRRR